MCDPVHGKVQKLFESRAKAEADLNKTQRDVTEAVNNAERRVRVERLVTHCEEAMNKAFAKNEQPLELANKTSDPATVKTDLEKWLNDTTVQNDEIVRSAREYIDQCPNAERSSQSSAKTSKKVKSSKASSSKVSKSSSQRQRELVIAQHKREEIERQNEATLRLAKQKQELELEQLHEENRKRLAAAHLVELELQDDLSEANEDLHETLSRLSGTSAANENQRISEWINNSPVVTINNNQPQAVVSIGIVTSIATTTAVTSSLSPLGKADPTTMTTDGTNQAPTAVGAPTTVVPVTTVGPNAVAQAVTSFIPPEPTVPVPRPSTSAISPQLPILQATSTFSHNPQPPLVQPRMPTFTMPVKHILPNLSAWTFPNPTINPTPIITTVPPQVSPTNVSTIPVAVTSVSNVLSMPVTRGGTVYYVRPTTLSTPTVYTTTTQPTTTLSPTAATFVPAGTTLIQQPSTTEFSAQDIALLLASSKKDHLPEWKLRPLQWHEWFGQFKSAIDSAPLTDDVKLTYLKTLVTGKAKTAISEFAYCGAMYKDALKALERKFGQPQTVVTAYLDKLSNFPPLKMHNSESIISYSATICSLVGVFRSLNYLQDLSSASLLGQAVQKLPPNMKEEWSMHTVKRTLDRPTLIDFNDWLKEKAEAHKRMKSAYLKPKVGDSTTTTTRTKTVSKVFASTASSSQQSSNSKSKVEQLSNCAACKDKHPLWRCPIFRKKTLIERAKLVAENKLCFSCFKPNHTFRQCPQPRKCTRDACGSSHNTFLHGAERTFTKNAVSNGKVKLETSGCIGTSINNEKPEENSGMPSVTDVKGLLQVTEVELQAHGKSEKVLALCDSACSHSWISANLAKKLNVNGKPAQLTVHGINSNQVVDTQMVELKLTPVHSGGSCLPFDVKPYVREDLTVGTDFIDVDFLKTKYPQFEPIALKK